MVVLGLGLVLLMGMQVFVAQIGNMIFSPGRSRPFVAYGDGRKAPIYDECLQCGSSAQPALIAFLDGAFAPSFFIFSGKVGGNKKWMLLELS